MLELIEVQKVVNGEAHIRSVSMSLAPGEISTFLGPVDAGKTSLLRLIAGLDKPTSGKVRLNGTDITSKSVQARNVAMVYQDFVNYPTMSVYENIASPLRVQGLPRKQIDGKVRAVAETVGLTDLLSRKPLTLSGGQQQRTALARALAKEADVILLDEPLANLDYKLREEMREELPRLVAGSKSVVVYATTEPTEALTLGGATATLHEGKLVQFGQAADIYDLPDTLASAQAFADPPLNLAPADLDGKHCSIRGAAGFDVPQHMENLSGGRYQLGVRPEHIELKPSRGKSLVLKASIELAEITGSETLVHFRAAGQTWVAVVPGIHNIDSGKQLSVSIDLHQLLVFDENGVAVARPFYGED